MIFAPRRSSITSVDFLQHLMTPRSDPQPMNALDQMAQIALDPDLEIIQPRIEQPAIDLSLSNSLVCLPDWKTQRNDRLKRKAELAKEGRKKKKQKAALMAYQKVAITEKLLQYECELHLPRPGTTVFLVNESLLDVFPFLATFKNFSLLPFHVFLNGKKVEYNAAGDMLLDDSLLPNDEIAVVSQSKKIAAWNDFLKKLETCNGSL